MPLVSVIIPTYNRATTLPQSIESVLNQTLDDFELLVVDDASTDRTESVVESYDDPRVTYLSHETNRGGSTARNTGLEYATGEYVAYLDSDDAFFPAKLERQVATLERRSDEWIAAYCGVEMVSEGGSNRLRDMVVDLLSRRRVTEGAEGGAELIGDVLANNLHTSAGSTLLVEREVVERIGGFDESFRRFQDAEFLIRVLEQGNLAYVDEPLVKRYASDRPPAEVVEAADEHYLETFSELVARFEAQGYDIRGAHHFMLAKQYFDEGRIRHGTAHLLKSRRPRIRQYPGLCLSIASAVRQRFTG